MGVACGALAGAALLGSTAFIAPTGPRTTEITHEVTRAGVVHDVSIDTPAATGWTATATVGEAGTSSSLVSTPVGKGGFVGATNGETMAVVSRCPTTGRAQVQQVRASTAMAAGPGTKTAINGFGRI